MQPLAARWNPAFNAFVGWIIRRAIRRRFRAVLVAGRDQLRVVDEGRAVVIVANHTNWWDGFVAQYVVEQLMRGRRCHVAQSAKYLRDYPFFTWAGAFGIDLEQGVLPGLRHAIELLRDRRVAMWIFPQGRIHHPDTPIRGNPGASFLSRKAGVQLLPVNFRYEWLVESRPTFLVRIGTPLAPGAMTEEIDSSLQNLNDQTKRKLDPIDLSDFVPLMRPHLSLNKKMDWVIAALRGRLRQFERDNDQ